MKSSSPFGVYRSELVDATAHGADSAKSFSLKRKRPPHLRFGNGGGLLYYNEPANSPKARGE
jgi:hypothetical protein